MKISSNNSDNLIKAQKSGYTLEQCFYVSPEIFDLDVEKIISKQWLLVDHVSRIPNIGDYFIFRVVDDEIIIIRGKDNEIYAHFNTCRHRGSKICTESQGNRRVLVCPYHAWSYELNGTLLGAKSMSDTFDKSQNNLHPCHLHVYEGLIFVNLSTSEPFDFVSEYQALQPHMDLHQLSDAKVVSREQWQLKCNWKLVVENFYECYHCLPSHPELSSVHSKAKYRAFGSGPSSAMPEAMAEFLPEYTDWMKNASALNYLPEMVDEDNNSISLKSASRLPINWTAGYVSETKNGKPASKLMGKFETYDGGSTAVSFNPLSTVLMPNDYAMIFRFTPISSEITDVEIIWMVDKNAEEGKDYGEENLRWLWYTTTQQDGEITEWNQAGVKSSRYQPQQYSEQEAALVSINKWYLNQLTS